jgi:transcriptional regulator with XRE-family HTH domain
MPTEGTARRSTKSRGSVPYHATQEEIGAFRRTLRNARMAATGADGSPMSQTTIAKAIGYSQTSIAEWEIGRMVPETPKVVFKLEQVLGLEPGALSRHLGYLPADADGSPTVEQAILVDDKLDAGQRNTLLTLYRSLTRP